MRKKLLILGLGSLSLCVYSAPCKFLQNDPHGPQTRIRRGFSRGQCLDTIHTRPLKVLNKNSAIKLANFHHDNQYWLATIPYSPRAIKRTLISVQKFGPELIAAHTQVQIDLNLGFQIELIGQNETNIGRRKYLNSFILSFEGQDIIGGPGYDIVRGLFDYMAIIDAARSLQQNDFMLGDTDRVEKIRLFSLKLTPTVQKRFLKNLLAQAEKLNKKGLMYNSLFRNCTSELMISLDRTLGIKRSFLHYLTELIPTRIPIVLLTRDLIKEVLPYSIP